MQLALAYSPTHAGAEDWDRELAWLRRVVDVLGHKFVAGELDEAPSNLTDALLERERKDVKAKWVRAIVRMAPEEMRNEWVRMTTDSLGYEMPERKKTMTAEEELRAVRALLKTQAPAVLALVDKELGR
jgi:hypothetical protein